MSDSSPRARWPAWFIPAALVVAAVLIRIYFATWDRVVWGDEPFYLWIGKSLWAGAGYNFFGYSGAHFPPLYPVLAGGLALLTNNLQWASNLIYIAAGALLVLPLYYLVRATVNATAAWMTGLVVALYPALTSGVLAWGTMTEPLYLLWVGLAVYLLFLALDQMPGRWRDYVLLGATLGLAYLTRTEALVLVVAMFGLLLIGRLLRRDRFPVLLGRLAAGLAIFLLVASPYLVYIRQETGHWNLTGAAGMAFVSMTGLAEKDPSAFDRSTWELDPASGEVYIFAPSSETEPLLPALLSDPLGLLRRLRAGLIDAQALFFSMKMAPWLLAGIAALGLLARPWPPRRLRGELALLASLAAPAAYVPFFVQERYLAGALIPMMVWIGIGAWVLGDWLAGTWAGLRARPLSDRHASLLLAAPAVVLSVLLVAMGPLVWQRMQRTHSFQPGHLAAAAELRALGVTPDMTVLSRYPAVAFHAGTRWAPTPFEAWPELEAYAKAHDAQYLVIDGWEASLRPVYDFLLTPSLAPPGLRYVTTVETSDDPVLIYAFQ
ncbi:MAG: glycosyltransferase family 39 protein [Anaerolineales bacterium]|nr:glycosyltransferase family 39 protein [Anaerolineales bacterium]